MIEKENERERKWERKRMRGKENERAREWESKRLREKERKERERLRVGKREKK